MNLIHLPITPSLLILSLAFLSGCEDAPLQEGSDSTEPTDTPAELPLDCALTETSQPMTDPVAAEKRECDWDEVLALPPGVSQQNFDRAFTEGTWSETMTWDDGVQREFTLTVTGLRNQRTLMPRDSLSCEAVVLVDANVTLEMPEEDIRWTQETTLVGSYSLLVWSMGSTLTLVVDEMNECDNRLLYQGRLAEGPVEGMWIAEDRITGFQGLLATQDDRFGTQDQ